LPRAEESLLEVHSSWEWPKTVNITTGVYNFNSMRFNASFFNKAGRKPADSQYPIRAL
jgi:hypothetical protein